jgi:maltooligosyltrehalose trehalohydrolase
MKWGPEWLDRDTVRFRLWAPDHHRIDLRLDGRQPVAMEQAGDGRFAAVARCQPGQRYCFVLPDGTAVPDPASRRQDGGVHGWSVLDQPARFGWTAGWRGRPWHEMVIEEVHVGLLGGFAGVATMLPEIAASGVTAIELMPVGAFAGTRNWGYDGVLPYAPAECYGPPDALRALVDRAHGLGLSVFLDVVYNHFGPDGNYLGAYASPFFDAGRHTPWGPGIAFDRAPVAEFFIGNARMWLEDYRIDGLRFDAVHAIGNPAFLDTMATALRRIDRAAPIHLVLENEDNDAPRLGPGRYDAQWNDDFHNAAHVLLTGEKEGYYAAFADAPARHLARCLGEGFAWQGAVPPGWTRPRGSPSGALPPTAFVSFLQNHDQIGNRALGERLLTLTTPARVRAAAMLQLLSPQVPLLFMGERDGSRSPFLFFTDFHDALADAVRNGRRDEFRHFAAFADEARRAAIPDPNDPATFIASVPAPGPDSAQWRTFYQALLGIRHREIMPRLPGARALSARPLGPAAVEAQWRMGDGALLSMAVDLGEQPMELPEMDGRLLWAETDPSGRRVAICRLAA